MSAKKRSTPDTLLIELEKSLLTSLRSPDGVASPAALLWTDADGQWAPLVPTLQKALPQLYVLDTFAPEERQGPVIWLKCIIERACQTARRHPAWCRSSICPT